MVPQPSLRILVICALMVEIPGASRLHFLHFKALGRPISLGTWLHLTELSKRPGVMVIQKGVEKEEQTATISH